MNDKHSVFIVDDDTTVLATYQKQLRDSFGVRAFTSTEQANTAAKATPPDVLLADIRLEMAGAAEDATKFLQKIRKGETNFDRYIPVVLFTDKELGTDAYRRAVTAWATDLRIKGVDISAETAAEVLDQAIRRVRLSRSDAQLIDALKRLRKSWRGSPTPKVIAVPVGGGREESVSIDDIITHIEENDELGQAFKAGLSAFYVSLLAGEEPPEPAS